MSKSRHVTVGQSFKATASAINPANSIEFLRKSTRCICVPSGNDSAKAMMPQQVKPLACNPKLCSDRLYSNPPGISSISPSSPNLLWPKFNVRRVWFFAWYFKSFHYRCYFFKNDRIVTKTWFREEDESCVMPLFQTVSEVNALFSMRASHK